MKVGTQPEAEIIDVLQAAFAAILRCSEELPQSCLEN